MKIEWFPPIAPGESPPKFRRGQFRQLEKLVRQFTRSHHRRPLRATLIHGEQLKLFGVQFEEELTTVIIDMPKSEQEETTNP
jgi:hypothetical protein